jgi:predicted enzyme related to lactoylglutathione lyase
MELLAIVGSQFAFAFIKAVASEILGEDGLKTAISKGVAEKLIDISDDKTGEFIKNLLSGKNADKKLEKILTQTLKKINKKHNKKFKNAVKEIKRSKKSFNTKSDMILWIKKWNEESNNNLINEEEIIRFVEQFFEEVKKSIKSDDNLSQYLSVKNIEKTVNDIKRSINDVKDEVKKEVKNEHERTRKYITDILTPNPKPDETSSKNRKFITVSTVMTPSNVFLGREKTIDDIKEKAKTKKVVLMNGMGGIGKTEICRYIFKYYSENENADGVKYLGWVVYHDSLEDTFFNNFYDITADNAKDYLEKVKDKINSEYGKKLLLFVDNANDITDDEAIWFDGLECRIIMTTRKEEIHNFKNYPIDKLSPDDCLKIYQEYSDDKDEKSIAYIKDIIQLADFHTQTVELLAKTQKNGRITAEVLFKLLQEKGFGLANRKEKVKTTVVKSNKNNMEENGVLKNSGVIYINNSLIENLSIIFDISNLAEFEEQLVVLRHFSLIASNEPIDSDTLQNWFSLDNLNPVNELIAKGWLKEDENNEISIHPVISEVVRYKYPAEFEFAQKLVNKIIDELKDSYEKGSGISVWNKLITHSVAVAKSFNKSEHEDYATLLNNIGSVYDKIGDYNKALEFYEKALNIRKKVLGTEHPNTATSYNNIGSTYDSMGDYNKALEFYENALNIREKVLGTEHPDTATSYNNIGGVYDSMGDYNKALEFYEKTLQIFKKALGTEHPDTEI